MDAVGASDWIRFGISLYGSAPDHPQHTAAHWGLFPAMTLSSKIIATQALSTGDSVGYGSTFVAPHPMQIGVVACGYADGYPRLCPSGAPVLVAGVRTRLVGRVSMDMITVDLTPVEQAGVVAGVGTEVTLWGRSSNAAVLGIDEVAHSAGTLGYELMCALAARVPVQVLES
jgi:alanine racemase